MESDLLCDKTHEWVRSTYEDKLLLTVLTYPKFSLNVPIMYNKPRTYFVLFWTFPQAINYLKNKQTNEQTSLMTKPLLEYESPNQHCNWSCYMYTWFYQEMQWLTTTFCLLSIVGPKHLDNEISVWLCIQFISFTLIRKWFFFLKSCHWSVILSITWIRDDKEHYKTIIIKEDNGPYKIKFDYKRYQLKGL